MTFTLSEDSADFAESSVTVVGGSLTNFEGSGKIYTATFEPEGISGSKSISVNINTFTDLAGGSNVQASNTFEWEHDPIVPTMSLSCAQGENEFYGNDALYTFTFVSSESTTDFNVGDIRIEGGNIELFWKVSFLFDVTRRDFYFLLNHTQLQWNNILRLSLQIRMVRRMCMSTGLVRSI